MTAGPNGHISRAKTAMTYEYVCTACGHQWEFEQPISSKPLKKCPQCERRSAKRQVSGGLGFILKGGGWYADGYGMRGKGKESKADSASDRPTGDSSSTAQSGVSSTSRDNGSAKSKSDGTKSNGDAAKAKPAGKGGGGAKSAAA